MGRRPDAWLTVLCVFDSATRLCWGCQDIDLLQCVPAWRYWRYRILWDPRAGRASRLAEGHSGPRQWREHGGPLVLNCTTTTRNWSRDCRRSWPCWLTGGVCNDWGRGNGWFCGIMGSGVGGHSATQEKQVDLRGRLHSRLPDWL